MIVGPEIILVVQIAVHGVGYQVTKPVTGDGHYNLAKCLYVAKGLRKEHEKRPEVEIVNIGCPYQETPIE